MAPSFGGKSALMLIMLLQTALELVICAEDQSSETTTRLPEDRHNSSREHREANAGKLREAIAEACDGLKENDPCTVPAMEDWEDWDDRDDHKDHKGGRGDKDREGDRERGDRGDRKHDEDREGDHERGDRGKGDRKNDKDREDDHERGDRGDRGRKGDEDRESDHHRGDRDDERDHEGRGGKGGKGGKGERSGTCVQDESHLFCKALPDGKDRARGSKTLKIGFTIQNIDFAELSANQLLFKNVKDGITEAVVTRIGGGITSRHITADVFAGSVIGSVLIHVPKHMSTDYVASQLSDSKALARAIENHVNAIPGIESVAHGKIEVNEDSIEVDAQGSESHQSATVKEESAWVLQVFYACVAVLALAFLLCTVAVGLYVKARNRSSNKSVDQNGSTVAFGRPVQSVAADACVVDGYVQTDTKKDLEKQ